MVREITLALSELPGDAVYGQAIIIAVENSNSKSFLPEKGKFFLIMVGLQSKPITTSELL